MRLIYTAVHLSRVGVKYIDKQMNNPASTSSDDSTAADDASKHVLLKRQNLLVF